MDFQWVIQLGKYVICGDKIYYSQLLSTGGSKNPVFSKWRER